MPNYFDSRHIMDYWERENQGENYAELAGTREPEPYEWGLEDAARPEVSTLEKASKAGAIGSGALSALGIGGAALGPVGMGLGVVATIAGMIGRKKAEEEQEEQREKAEALRRAAFMSQNRQRATGRWGY